MRQIQFSQVIKLVAIEHLVEVSKFATCQIEFLDVFGGEAAEPAFKNLVRQPTSESLLCFHALGVLDAEAVEDAEPSEMEYAVNSIILFLNQIVAWNVENYQSL